jgi:1-acyl-sn-glycerol-3-phosphate acyltransferase
MSAMLQPSSTAPVAPGAAAGPVELRERPVQTRGSRLALALMRLAGWRLDFDGLPALQGVIAVYPHTSNWDFPVGILAKWAMGIPAAFWGKDALFKVPVFGAWMRWVGGVPVDRSAPRGIVGDMIDRMERARQQGDFMWLALAPEGTRSPTEGWRSGFYRVAVGADVPLALAHLDFGRRRVGVAVCLRLSGNEEADMAEIERHLAGVRGCRPANASPIRLV